MGGKPIAITDERIDHIVGMFLDGTWEGMRTRRELAKEWGCHQRTVGDMAERASAVVARRGKPIEQAIDAKLADLERLQQKAEDAGEFKDAINAIKLYCEVRGFLNKGRQKETAADDGDEYAKLSRVERIARLEAAKAEELAALAAEEQAGKGEVH